MTESTDGQELIPVDSLDRSDTSRSERAYEWLRQRIFSGDIQPGTVLREVQLAQEAGVSRTPIRDGLLRLAKIGLVKRYANRGSVVVEMGVKEIWECLEVQQCTETYSLRVLLTEDRSPFDISVLDNFLHKQEEALQQQIYWEFFRNDRAMHMQIVSWTENSRLVQIMSDVSDLLIYGGYQTIRKRARLEEALDEHKILVEALRRHDLEASLAASIQHVKNAKRRLLV
jgi:DNA-binding GntR family transcriptional regulator